jgi:hypothetical protein
MNYGTDTLSKAYNGGPPMPVPSIGGTAERVASLAAETRSRADSILMRIEGPKPMQGDSSAAGGPTIINTLCGAAEHLEHTLKLLAQIEQRIFG